MNTCNDAKSGMRYVGFIEKTMNEFCKKWEQHYPNIWCCFCNENEEYAGLIYTCKWSDSDREKARFFVTKEGRVIANKNHIPATS